MYVHIKQYDGFNNWISYDFNAGDMMQHVKKFKHVPRERFTFYDGRGKYKINYMSLGYWQLWRVTARDGDTITYTRIKYYKRLKNALNAMEGMQT